MYKVPFLSNGTCYQAYSHQYAILDTNSVIGANRHKWGYFVIKITYNSISLQVSID